MINDVLNDADAKMAKSVEATREDFATIRAGRANPAMFAKLTADYYGTQTPLQQLASFTSQDARTIVIAPFDMGAMAEIEKSIRDSDLGVNPSNDGHVIRCVLPVLTEDRRREYIKLAHHKAEEARVSIRNIRRKAKTDFEHAIKEGDIGEDEGQRAEKELEGLTKKYVESVDTLLKGKEAELLEI